MFRYENNGAYKGKNAEVTESHDIFLWKKEEIMKKSYK